MFISAITSTLRQSCLLLATLLLCHATLADDVVYRLDILSGAVKQTPANINLSSPVSAELSGYFYATVSNTSVQFSDAVLGTEPETGFELSTIAATYNGFDISAAGNDSTFDNGFTGTFDGNTLTIKGSRDSRPVDGPLVEYEFTAVVVVDDVVTTTGGNDQFEHDFFIARADLRKCATPMCGGFFVSQVNRHKTLCADGHYRAACYVARIESTTPATLRAGRIHKNMLLEGRIAKAKHAKKRPVSIFKARKAWLPATDMPLRNSSTFVALQNNGIMCISSPCFSYDEYKLNTEKSRAISNIDFSKTGATPKQVTAAYNSMADGGILLAAGDNRRIKEFSGMGVTLVARQFFLPIKSTPIVCAKGYTYKKGQCVTPYGCIAPELELQAFGGAAMVDPVTGELEANITKSCVSSCDAPAILARPGRCKVYYP